jgi:hypothetical protein
MHQCKERVVQAQEYDQNVAVLTRGSPSPPPILKWWEVLLGVVETRVTVMTGVRRALRQCDDRPLLFRSSPARGNEPIRIWFVVNARLTSFVWTRIQNWKGV